MIRNIIFDLGNVLLSWRPADFLKKSGYDKDNAELIQAELFKSQVWQKLDNGDITTSEAIDLLAETSSLKKAEISSLFNLRSKIIFPLADNVKILPELQKQGFRLYYLSNFPRDFFYEIKDDYDLFRFFDGGVISADVRYSKPDPRIYEILLEKYGLRSEECLYIDDIEINVKSAELKGILGLCTFGSESVSDMIFDLLAGIPDNDEKG